MLQGVSRGRSAGGGQQGEVGEGEGEGEGVTGGKNLEP